MLRVTLKHGSDKTFIRIEGLTTQTHKAIRNAFSEIGRENVRHVRKLMREKKTGRIYNIDGKEHQASAPGEAPAVLSKKLIRTLGYKTYSHSRMEFGDRMFYGKFLEKGTDKIAQRPHIEKTVLDKEKDTQITFIEYTNRFVLSR
jgi:hypothetical protein